MDADELRSIQSPLKERYRSEPAAARITLRARSRLGEGESFDDLCPGRGVGGRRERDARHLRPALVQHRQLTVLRSKVVAPLRHAMRFIDGEERNPRPLDQLQRAILQ